MKKVVIALFLLIVLLGSVYAYTGEKSWVSLILEKIFFLEPQQRTIQELSSTPLTTIPVSQPFKSACGIDKDVIVEETASATLLKNGTLEVQPIEGKVRVRNKSGKDRLWDIIVRLTNVDSTDISNPVLMIDEILPGKTEETFYTSSPTFPITYSEVYDTYSSDPQPQKYFVFGTNMPVSIDVDIGSNSEKVLDISYSRTVPTLKNVVVRGADYNSETRTLSWNGRLRPEQNVRIRIEGEVLATNIENITLGSASMEITSDEKLLTGAEIWDVSAQAPNNWYHKSYQDERDRGLWHIEMKLTDLSDFQTSIKKIRVYDAVTEDVLKDVSNVYLTLQPGESWEEKLTYRASHFPSFIYDFEYTAKLDHGTCSASKLESEPLDFQVAKMSMKKELDSADFDVDKNKEIEVKLEVINEGNAPISELFVEDRVCSGFEASNIKASLIDNFGKKDITNKIEFTAQDSKVSFRIPDFIDSAERELDHLDKVVFEYTLKPVNPSPGECRTEAVGYGNTNPTGPQIRLSSVTPISVTEGLQGVSVERTQVSRELIRIRVENVGKSQTPEAELRAYLPESFVLKSSSRDYRVDGRYVVWSLGKIDAGQTIAIQYSIGGTGNYMSESQEPFITVAQKEAN